MGSNSSTHSTKDQREETRKTTVQTQLNKINNINNTINNTMNNTINNANESSSNSVMKKTDMESILKMTTVAKTQLERDNKPFTKTDLITILLKIATLSGNIKNIDAANKMIEEYNKYTVGELHAFIRCAIYDMSMPKNSNLNTSNTLNASNASNIQSISDCNKTNNMLIIK
jgi:hypothetical protein